MSVTFLLPAGRSRDRDWFSHGCDVPYDHISQGALCLKWRLVFCNKMLMLQKNFVPLLPPCWCCVLQESSQEFHIVTLGIKCQTLADFHLRHCCWPQKSMNDCFVAWEAGTKWTPWGGKSQAKHIHTVGCVVNLPCHAGKSHKDDNTACLLLRNVRHLLVRSGFLMGKKDTFVTEPHRVLSSCVFPCLHIIVTVCCNTFASSCFLISIHNKSHISTCMQSNCCLFPTSSLPMLKIIADHACISTWSNCLSCTWLFLLSNTQFFLNCGASEIALISVESGFSSSSCSGFVGSAHAVLHMMASTSRDNACLSPFILPCVLKHLHQQDTKQKFQNFYEFWGGKWQFTFEIGMSFAGGRSLEPFEFCCSHNNFRGQLHCTMTFGSCMAVIHDCWAKTRRGHVVCCKSMTTSWFRIWQQLFLMLARTHSQVAHPNWDRCHSFMT